MLLKTFTKEIFRPECNPQFQSLHCFVHLDQDIGKVIPYLNAVFGGTGFIKDPPSVMFRNNGRLISVHAKKIAINALEDEKSADKIISWLHREINEIWERRDEIEPCFNIPAKPQMIDILKLLPKTNCKECGQPTCMVFASLMVQGIKEANDCPAIEQGKLKSLERHMSNFQI